MFIDDCILLLVVVFDFDGLMFDIEILYIDIVR